MKTSYLLMGVGAVVALGLAYKFLWKKDGKEESKSGIVRTSGNNIIQARVCPPPTNSFPYVDDKGVITGYGCSAAATPSAK